MVEPRPRKLLDQMWDAIRVKHYSYRTEETYVAWAHRYILFHNKQHPKEMGAAEIEAFLTHLAVQEQVAASTGSYEPIDLSYFADRISPARSN